MPDESIEQELQPAGVAPSIIANVYLWANGQVTAYDDAGRELASYSGPINRVRGRIIADAPAEAVFRVIAVGLRSSEISRATFAEWPG